MTKNSLGPTSAVEVGARKSDELAGSIASENMTCEQKKQLRQAEKAAEQKIEEQWCRRGPNGPTYADYQAAKIAARAAAREDVRAQLPPHITRMSKPPTDQHQLITTIKAHIAKGDKAAEKAEQHYIAAGQHLKTLKAAHTGTWDEWETLLKTEIGIGKSRASELMQISDGTKTLKRVRADTAKRTADAKARLKLSASGGESVDDPEASAEAMKTAFAADEVDQAAQPELYACDPADTTAPQVPLDANPICHAWRLASNEERAEFVRLFADDLRRLGDDHHQDADGDDDIPKAKANPPRQGKKKLQETRLSGAVADAFSELQDLACEVRDVVENTPENLSQTQRILTLDETAGVLEGLIEPAVSASDRRDLSEDLNPAAAEANERAAAERKAAEEQAFADKLAKRPPPSPVERAEIKKARKRTKARAPRIAINIEDRGTAGRASYPDHCDEEGHRYRLVDTFGTRSLEFVSAMLNGLGIATADHLLDYDSSPGSANQVAFNAALAVISGVRPKDEIEAMLAAHMAVTNIALLELVARTRGSIANYRYESDGIKRLDVVGNLTNKFMRTYTMQIEALARKRRKGEQNIRVKHVHVYADGQAIVGNVRHRGGRGTAKK
jgi:hypothetical protein